MDDSLILAYDLGTSGAKCALVTTKGELVCAATADYPLDTGGGPHWAEQAPEDYWQAVCRATKETLTNTGVEPERIVGMAFGTMWKGIIPVDSQGNVLRKCILWMDGRAGEQAKRLNEHFGGHYVSTDYWPKLLWLRENEPQIIEKAAWILEVNSYLKWKATGVAAVDISNNYVHSFDPQQDARYEALFSFMDIPREKFPRFVNAWDTVGSVTAQAAQELGVLPGTPVFGGNNDIQGVAVGAGCGAVGDVHAYFGSSGWIGFMVPHGEKYTSSHMDTQRDVFMAGMKSVGMSQNWMVKNLYGEEYRKLGSDVFGLVDREISQIPAGSAGLLATPWIHGERPPHGDLETGGSFLNLRSDHTRSHMARAMLEGICFHLRQRLEYSCEMRGYSWPKKIHAVGGGACSEVWMQILADVMNVEVQVPANPRHAGAIGTAYSAIMGLGLCSDYTDVSKILRIQRTFLPNPDTVAVYKTCFRAYTQVHQALKPICSQLNFLR